MSMVPGQGVSAQSLRGMTQQQREKKKIKEWLDSLGPRCFHFPVLANGYGKNGVGDRVACIDGRFIMIEVLAEGEPPKKWQAKRIEEAQAAGGVGIAVHFAHELISYLAMTGFLF